MQAKKIIALMRGEIAYDETTLPEIQNLVEEYPYFQTARFLYTFNLRANKDSRFDAELKKTACHAGDRKKLFYQTERNFFSPEIMERLKQKENDVSPSSFDLIDYFLEGKAKKRKRTKQEAIHSSMISTDYLSHSFSDTQEETKSQQVPLQHQATIDKFLEENEKTPVKIVLGRESESPSENPLSNLDTINPGSFFSETLVKIYLKQKKYTKALEIIRQLNLIYPEKNRYFADQIRFLEKLIINTKRLI